MSEDVSTRFGGAPARIGRTPATTHGELSHIALNLFIERGFDETTMNDIAEAAGIGRRTLFRYFSTKNELPWGDFDLLLDDLRAYLARVPDTVPVMEALRLAVVDFNTFPEDEHPYHRGRMRLLLTVPSLNAYALLKYADWRQVIADYVAGRRGEPAEGLTAQTISWACLGICIGSYERWLDDPDASLTDLIDESFRTAESVFGINPSPEAEVSS